MTTLLLERPYRPCPEYRAWRAANPKATEEQRTAARKSLHVRQETASERKARKRANAESWHAAHAKRFAGSIARMKGGTHV